MNTVPVLAVVLLQRVPPQALVLAMVISYALGLAGMMLAYLNYRQRHRRKDHPKREEPRP